MNAIHLVNTVHVDVKHVDALADVSWPNSAVFVCDRRALAHLGTASPVIVVDAGESLKTMSAVAGLAEQILQVRSTRPITLIAVGGGSVLDAVGFVASILWRGVPLWNVPTTLLAAGDSAHGGKTAVNLGTAKNQLGTFWPAEQTVIARDVLATLPVGLRADGLTELVKACWLAGDVPGDVGELAFAPWSHIDGDLVALLERAIAFKLDVVRSDPREELGIRTQLNLGHTAAHALELTCGLPHGMAVAWGLAAAAHLSAERQGFEDRDAIWRDVYPLLGDLRPDDGSATGRPSAVARDGFVSAIDRDKKRRDGQLRSVLLRSAGEPVVVDDVEASQWFDAIEIAHDELFHAPVSVALAHPREVELVLPPSKSEANRALIIAAIRGQPLPAVGRCDDTRALRRAIDALRRGDVADAFDGGTTARFSFAYAASLPRGGRVRMSARLAKRPHEPLWAALRAAGSTVQLEGRTVFIGPLPDGPLRFEVDASQSSQFASALHLLGAGDRSVEVSITGGLASPGYLAMTQTMVEQTDVTISADASAAAIWRVFNALLGGDFVRFAAPPSTMQPDVGIASMLAQCSSGRVNVSNAPDCVPVLAAYATRIEQSVVLSGAPQLAWKESNRIVDLVAAFAEVGVEVEPLQDGIRVPVGVQVPTAGASFDPRRDHRLAFAALLLSCAAPLVVQDPRCVTKSYPALWNHARSAGFSVSPKLNDRLGQSPDT